MSNNSKYENRFRVIVLDKERQVVDKERQVVDKEREVVDKEREDDKKEINENLYKVGSRIICNKSYYNLWGNWFIQEIKGKKIRITQLALKSTTKLYNISYFNKLLSEGIIELRGMIGQPKLISLSDEIKKDILNLKIFSEKGVEGVEQLLLWGAERCDWKVVCNKAYVDDDKFEEFMKIIKSI